MLVGFSSFAMPSPTSKEAKKATTSTLSSVESNTALSAKQVQDENLQLKKQLSALMDENEELKGSLSFQTTMQKMFTQLNEQKQVDVNEELNALSNYNATMSKVVKTLQASKAN